MNPLIFLGILALSFTSSTYHAEAKGLNLEEVVRALDALYKRQQPGAGATPSFDSGTTPSGAGSAGSSGPAATSGNGSGDTTHGYGSGGETSGYGNGGTTPGYGSGGETSGYGSGGKTPGYGSGIGSGSGGMSGMGGSGSSGYSGEGSGYGGCVGQWGIMYMLQEFQDRLFIQNLRTVTGSFNGVCVDIFGWLNTHTVEYEEATESEGGYSSDSYYDFKKRSAKMEAVKRSLRGLQKKMEQRSGDMDGGYTDAYSGEEDLNDEDIMWHRLYMSCYVWLHLSNQDAYYKK